jgi:glutamate racemase
MLAEGIDTIVLGCTHYPFVIPQIEAIAGPGVRVIDPSPAVAAQTGRVLEREGLRADGGSAGGVHYLTTGDPGRMAEQLRVLLGVETEVEQIDFS